MTRIVAMPLPDADGIALAAACLSPAERTLMEKYRHPRRRAEFVAGRLSAKRALLEPQANSLRICADGLRRNPVSPQTAQRIDILPDQAGRPCIEFGSDFGSDGKRTSISISHAAGWVAAACSDRPIGLDIVDGEAATGWSDRHGWLADCPPQWRMRLSALSWGFHECLLKAGALPASAGTLWELANPELAPLLPLRSAAALIADWPAACRLASLEIAVGARVFAGAFMPLDATAMLVMVLLPMQEMQTEYAIEENLSI
ncbi:hypothetical protein D9O50_01215 [Oxalobacteraceae bacterium CAVE-383]|nr:hypothetical protein D9O50_01215 [Oxalobacteraceae bacterium CAVE-383]